MATRKRKQYPTHIEKLSGADISLLGQIADRAHVSKSTRELVREIGAKNGTEQTFSPLASYQFMRAIAKRHLANRVLYVRVMSGNI
jgi:hypothetical protein